MKVLFIFAVTLTRMKSLRHKLAGMLAFVAAAALVAMPATLAFAQTGTSTNNDGNVQAQEDDDIDIKDLVIWSALFNNNTTVGSGVDVGDLVVLEALTDDDDGDGGILGDSDSNIEDLVIWSALFNNNTSLTTNLGTGGILNTGGTTNLNDLVVWSILFDDDGGDSDIEDLVVFSTLFNQGGSILGGNQTVTVRSGDTLSGIALRVYGNASRWPEIANANNITDPTTLRVGQVLVIPGGGSSILGGTNNGLGNLVILDALFGDDGDGLGGLFD